MDTEECLPRFYGDISAEEINDEEERCSACSSFGNGLGVLSNDHEAETSYVSTQVNIFKFKKFNIKFVINLFLHYKICYVATKLILII